MQKSTLINTLKSFSPKEIREFGEFVNSPFFNKNQAAIKLFEYIKKYYPAFESGKLEKESIYKNLFGKSEYNESFMKTIIHILSELTEKYLFYINMQNKPALEKIITSEELFNRKLEKPLTKMLADSRKEIEKLKNVNQELYYYYLYMHCSLNDSYIFWARFKNKNLKSYNTDGNDDKLGYITKSYFEVVLVAYRSVLTIREQAPFEIDEAIPENVVNFLINNPKLLEGSPALNLHLNEILLLKEKSEKHYYTLKEILITGANDVNLNKLFTTNTILQQYCLRKVSEGKSPFQQERFELYKISLEKKFYRLSTHTHIDTMLYGNIALVAIKLNELEWAESFIKKYSPELHPENSEMEFYAKARLSFKRKEFEQSLEYLNSMTNMIPVPIKMIIRSMMLMIYYELSYFDQGESLHASYRKFITPNEEHLSPERQERHKKFLQYYIKLLILKQTEDRNAANKLAEEINGNPNVVEHDWLVEKANELVKY